VVLFQNSPSRTEGDKTLTVSGPRHEPYTSWITNSKSTNIVTTTFDMCSCRKPILLHWHY